MLNHYRQERFIINKEDFLLPEEEGEVRGLPPFIPLVIFLALLFILSGLLYSMIIKSKEYDREISKGDKIIKELEREIELIRPLKLKIRQYKQAIQTIEEEIQVMKEQEKKDSSEMDEDNESSGGNGEEEEINEGENTSEP